MFPLRALLMLGACVVIGCSSSGIDTRRALTPDDIMRHVDAKNAETFAVSAYGTISIDSPDLSQSANLLVHLLKPDSLYIEVTGPFGLGAVKGLVTRKQFTLYNGVDNTVLTGASTPANLRNVLRVALDFDEIMQILAGTSGFTKAIAGVAPEGVLSDDLYRITWRDKNEVVAYDVDVRYEAVRRYQRRDRGGALLEEVTYKDFRKLAGRYRPHIISLARPPSDESLVIVYNEQQINDLPMDFSFKIPESAKKIRY